MVDSCPDPAEVGAAQESAHINSGEQSEELQGLGAKLAERLELTRALTFVDLETTGLDVCTARIVEVALVRVEPTGSAASFATLINPTISIPAEATRVHSICNDDVADAPTFAEAAATVGSWLAESDLGGYNLARFDLPLLDAEFERAGHPFAWDEARILDACAIFKRMER